MKKKLRKYWRVWYIMSRNALAGSIHSKLSFGFFLVGKIVRFAFFVFFLLFLVRGTGSLAGYSVDQVIFVFLTFNIVDVVGQFLYREVYRFKPLILSGDFDLVLTKPMSALFRGLMGGADFIDLMTIPILLVVVVMVGARLEPSVGEVLLFGVLVVNGLVITTAFHIAILGLYVRFLELDYVLWFYRDLLNLGKLPVGVYREPLRTALVYIVPVATMVTLPARALMGLVSWGGIMVSLIIGAAMIWVAMKFWRYSLSFYMSASS